MDAETRKTLDYIASFGAGLSANPDERPDIRIQGRLLATGVMDTIIAWVQSEARRPGRRTPEELAAITQAIPSVAGVAVGIAILILSGNQMPNPEKAEKAIRRMFADAGDTAAGAFTAMIRESG